MSTARQMVLGEASPSFARAVRRRQRRVTYGPVSALHAVRVDGSSFARGDASGDAIGAELGISGERVRQIGHAALQRLQAHKLAVWLGRALPAASEDAVVDLVVFAVRLVEVSPEWGWRFARQEFEVGDLVALHERFRVYRADCALGRARKSA